MKAMEEAWEYARLAHLTYHITEHRLDFARRRRWLRKLVATDLSKPAIFRFKGKKEKVRVYGVYVWVGYYTRVDVSSVWDVSLAGWGSVCGSVWRGGAVCQGGAVCVCVFVFVSSCCVWFPCRRRRMTMRRMRQSSRFPGCTSPSRVGLPCYLVALLYPDPLLRTRERAWIRG